MAYRVIWEKEADRVMARLDQTMRERLLAAGEALANNPRPSGSGSWHSMIKFLSARSHEVC